MRTVLIALTFLATCCSEKPDSPVELVDELPDVQGHRGAGYTPPVEDIQAESGAVSWGDLRQLKLKTGRLAGRAAEINRTKVKIPGYIVPLDDMSYTEVSEFILVPNALACIHVPPPPPNQMVYVVMKPGEKAPFRYGRPVYVEGLLEKTTVKSPFGKVAWALNGSDAYFYDD